MVFVHRHKNDEKFFKSKQKWNGDQEEEEEEEMIMEWWWRRRVRVPFKFHQRGTWAGVLCQSTAARPTLRVARTPDRNRVCWNTLICVCVISLSISFSLSIFRFLCFNVRICVSVCVWVCVRVGVSLFHCFLVSLFDVREGKMVEVQAQGRHRSCCLYPIDECHHQCCCWRGFWTWINLILSAMWNAIKPGANLSLSTAAEEFKVLGARFFLNLWNNQVKEIPHVGYIKQKTCFVR